MEDLLRALVVLLQVICLACLNAPSRASTVRVFCGLLLLT